MRAGLLILLLALSACNAPRNTQSDRVIKEENGVTIVTTGDGNKIVSVQGAVVCISRWGDYKPCTGDQ